MKWLLLSIIVFATVLSDLLQSYEMKRSGEQSVNARGLGQTAADDRQPALSVPFHCLHGGVVLCFYGAGANRSAQLCGSSLRGHFRP